MNISAKFQLYRPYSFCGVDFLNNFRKFKLLVAMTKKFRGWDKNYRFDRGPLNKYF